MGTFATAPAERRDARVVVVGSVNRDIVVTASRRPVVGETLMGSTFGHYPGGKGANQAVAAARAGASTHIVGCIGSDDAGADLRDHLTEAGVDVGHLRVVEQQTGHAFVTLVDGDNSVIVIAGANGAVSPEDVSALELTPRDTVVGQFEIPDRTVERLLAHGNGRGARTIINPSPVRDTSAAFWDLCDVIVVNELELAWLQDVMGRGGTHRPHEPSATQLLRHPDQAIVITLGVAGCAVVETAGVSEIRGHEVEAVDTTGAGDCFVGNLAAQLAAGESLVAAASIANAAAALCVQRMGASSTMPYIEETLATISPTSP